MIASNDCPDCNGTGVYVGLGFLPAEPCRLCGGLGVKVRQATADADADAPRDWNKELSDIAGERPWGWEYGSLCGWTTHTVLSSEEMRQVIVLWRARQDNDQQWRQRLAAIDSRAYWIAGKDRWEVRTDLGIIVADACLLAAERTRKDQLPCHS